MANTVSASSRLMQCYSAAKAHVRALMDASGHGDEIATPARLIQADEQTHFPIADPDPSDALLFRMEQEGIDWRGLCGF